MNEKQIVSTKFLKKPLRKFWGWESYLMQIEEIDMKLSTIKQKKETTIVEGKRFSLFGFFIYDKITGSKIQENRKVKIKDNNIKLKKRKDD